MRSMRSKRIAIMIKYSIATPPYGGRFTAYRWLATLTKWIDVYKRQVLEQAV